MHEDSLTELRDIAERLEDSANREESAEVKEPLRKVMNAAAELGKAWSASNLGYHSRVYYKDLKPPVPGAHFDSEWGFRGPFQGTTGDWAEFDFDYVVAAVYELAQVDSLDPAADLAHQAADAMEAAKPEVVSVLRAWLTGQTDPLIEELCSKAESLKLFTERKAQEGLLGSGGKKITRDSTAVSEGLRAAPHQVVEARAITISSSFKVCGELAQIARRAAAHIERLETSQRAKGQTQMATGTHVFIGHGQTDLWKVLKEFISERLQLPWDEFNRVPVAGVTNVARLSEMLDNAGIAFLVLAAEDETVGGTERARQNVVHEAGLFQGRLGFSRAIILLEEGCEEFSNIEGLGQIRFPRGDISAAFENVRRVLEREGFLDPP